MSPSLLAGVEMAPRDPILGVTETFNADDNPNKVNLGVGVYYDDNGKVPVLECVRRAEQKLAESALPRNYLPIDGLQAYDRAVQELLFGAGSAVEAKADGFLVWRAPQPNASGAPEGMSLPRRELIGRGVSRREALESARRALKK